MRNRILALLLALSCILSASATATYAEDETTAAAVEVTETAENATEEAPVINETVAKKLEFLQAFGTMQEYTKEKTIENPQLTRSEFVQMAYSLYKDFNATGSVNYTDVPEDAPYREALLAFDSLHIVDGNNEGKFLPDTIITGKEAMKMAVCMLGGKVDANWNGGYYEGFVAVGYSMGLNKGIAFLDDFRYNDAITLLYNVFTTDMNVINSLGTNGSYEVKEIPFMENYLKAYKFNGYVESNEYTGTIGKSACEEGYVVIGGRKYADPNGVAGKYVGYNVTFYYTVGEYDKIIAFAEPDRKVKEVTFTSDELFADSGKLSLFNLVYVPDGSSSMKEIKLSEDVTVIYNGKEYSDFSVDGTYKTVNGTFTAVSNDGSKVYDTLIIEDYKYYIVETVNVAESVVLDKFGEIFEFDAVKQNIDKITWENQDGSPVILEEIYEWNALAVKESIDGKLIEVTVVKNTSEGRVDSVATNDDGDKVIVIDGTEYVISPDYVALGSTKYPTTPNIGTKAFLVLDMLDNVLLIDTDSEDYRAGILVKASLGDDTINVKIYEDTGLFAKYVLSDKLRIDGYSMKKHIENVSYDDIVTALQEGDVMNYVTSEESSDPVYAGKVIPTDFVFQFIRYAVDAEGKISKIDTGRADKNVTAGELIKMYDVDTDASRGKALLYKSGDTSFGKIMGLKSTTVNFFVPCPLDYENASAYALELGDKPFKNDKRYTFIPYGTDYSEALSLNYTVSVNAYTASISGCTPTMFDRKYTALNEDDEPEIVIEAWEGNKKLTLYAPADNTTVATALNGLEKGDLFKYGTDATKKVSAVEKYFDYSEGRFDADHVNMNSTNMYDAGRAIYADAYKIVGGRLAISNVYGSDGSYTLMDANAVPDNSLMETFVIGYFVTKRGLVVYDEENDTISEISANDIKTYELYKDNRYKVFALTNFGEADLMYVYNLDR